MVQCQRCFKHVWATIMSMFNTQMICMECKELEKKDPRYKEAQKAEREALKNGNRNFRGIGY